MEYATLGKTGRRVSRLGLGCWAIGGHGYGHTHDQESIRVVQTALDLGIDFFDTADVYGLGHSEALLGRALGARRHEVLIATKFGVAWDRRGVTWRDTSPERVVTALEGSLRRLRVNCVPLYQIHWHDGETPIEATMEALARCQEAGKIHHFGCCNFTPPMIRRASRIRALDTVQFQFSLLHPDTRPGLAECVRALGMGTIVYGVLGRGLLSGEFGAGTVFDDRDTRRRDPDFQGDRLARGLKLADTLRAAGLRQGRTAAQTAIRWALDSDEASCAVVGAKSVAQMRENVGAIGWRLDAAERDLLTRAAVAVP